MIRFPLLAMVAAMTLSFAMPVSAQARVRDLPICRMPIEALDSGVPPAPTASAAPMGCETTTRPWSAPVGHRQPQAIELEATDATASIDEQLTQENARIDRLIQGICRGC